MRARFKPSRFGVLVVVLLLLMPLLTVSGGSSAATPPQGSVGPSHTSRTWQGMVYPAQVTALPDECPPAADPANLRCDHYMLTVNVAASYWNTHTGGVDVTITWDSADDDFDLYVYDSQGNQVDSSGQSGTTSERVFIENAAGTYEVRVVPFMVVTSGYNGSATFVSRPGGPKPNPARATGGLAFGPATVVDPQRTEGEPLNFIDRRGNYWESGPWGTSTQQSFIHRSLDSGDQFNIVSPIALRPNPPPGGGDTDIVVDDVGNAYFTDLEGLVKIDASVSNDGGNTWRKNAAVEATSADDRQWYAIDNGPTGDAGDNTVFLVYREAALGSFIYSSPGSTGPTDPVGGLVYQLASDATGPVNTGAPCGQMRFDRVRRNLYYACADGDHIALAIGHVNPSQRTGIHFNVVNTPASPGGGPVGDIFPAVAIDRAGNVYVVWIDESDHNVYYAWSRDAGQHWSSPVHINGNDANSNVFPWAQAGASGDLVVAWYGSPTHLDSDNLPSWYNDRRAADDFPWYGYVSLIRNAASASPNFVQQRFTQAPMHYGQICNGGIGCTVSNGDRTMADFFGFTFDPDGAIRLVFNDTTSQHHGAHLFEVRQLAGPTALGTTLSKPRQANPMADKTGDAQWPHYGPAGPGRNQAQLDLTQLRIAQPNATTLRIEMTVRDLSSLMPPAGKTRAVWLTRFQALSRGDEGERAYRIFYVGMESTAGGAPSFFAGSGQSASDNVPGNGCITNTPENCKVVEYPVEVSASGKVSGNKISITVHIQGGFGANRPIFGDLLYNVTAFTLGRNNDSTDLYADVDATRAFNFQLNGTSVVPPPPEGCSGLTVSGSGALPTANGYSTEATFALNVCASLFGKVAYQDPGSNISFRSTRIDAILFDDDAHTAIINGEGILNDSARVTFRAAAVDQSADGSNDRFSISLSNGSTYGRGARLARGNIVIN